MRVCVCVCVCSKLDTENDPKIRVNLVYELHREGINLRFLGLIRNLAQKYVCVFFLSLSLSFSDVCSWETRRIILIEMVARILKHNLRQQLRLKMKDLQVNTHTHERKKERGREDTHTHTYTQVPSNEPYRIVIINFINSVLVFIQITLILS